MCVFGKHSKVSITVVKVRQPAVISCGPHHASTQCDTNRAAEQHGRLIPAFCGRRRGVEKKKGNEAKDEGNYGETGAGKYLTVERNP